MNLLKNLKVSIKLAILVGVFAVGFVAFGSLAHRTLSLAKVNGPYYNRVILGKDLIADVLPPPEYLIESYLVALEMIDELDPAKLAEMVSKSRKLREEYSSRHEFWCKNLAAGTLKELMTVKAFKPGLELLDIRDQQLIPALLRGDREQAAQIARGKLKAAYENHRAAIDEVVTLATQGNIEEEQQAASVIATSQYWLFVLGAGILTLACVTGYLIARCICGPLGQTVQALRALAIGDTSVKLGHASKDEPGLLADACRGVGSEIQGVADELKELIQAAREGRLDVRGDASRFQGVYAELVGNLNEMMDAVASPLHEASEVLEKVAGKDLTPRVQGTYLGGYAKISRALNTALDNLAEALTQARHSSENVTTAAGEISAAGQNLASGASEQASSLEEVSSSVQELSSMTRQNTLHARETKDLSDLAKQSAGRGVENMRRLSEAIEKIKGTADKTAKIVKTIDEIAFQTNLLALNAAVEAARAGDAGKGFAVVAEEVRNLAMRSAEAAKSTAALIDASVHSAEDGVSFNQEVLKDFEEISSRVNKVSDVMTEIAAASEQQSQGIEQINTAVDQISNITQRNAAHSEETAASAEELYGQAASLRSTVATFVLRSESPSDTATLSSRSSRTEPTKPQQQALPTKRFAPHPGSLKARSSVSARKKSRTVVDDAVLEAF